MIKEIFIGDDQSNIIQKLMSSKIAKVIFFITCLIVYANSRVVGIPDLIILILKALIITNILYIPIRLVYSEEIGFGYKGVFTITEVCLLGSYTNTDMTFSLLFLLYYFIVTILVSLIITKFVIYIFKESNIISDTSCYFDNKVIVDYFISENKEHNIPASDQLKKQVEELFKKKNTEERKRLRKKYNDFYTEAKEMKTLQTEVKCFESKIEDDIKNFLEKSDDKETNQDKNLINLKYFLKNKKRFDAISVQSIREIMEMMQRTGTWDLFAIKAELKNYIEVLENHLELAKAVYVVALDTGDINNQ